MCYGREIFCGVGCREVFCGDIYIENADKNVNGGNCDARSGVCVSLTDNGFKHNFYNLDVISEP